MRDRLPIERVDHLQLFVGNARQAASCYERTLGFAVRAATAVSASAGLAVIDHGGGPPPFAKRPLSPPRRRVALFDGVKTFWDGLNDLRSHPARGGWPDGRWIGRPRRIRDQPVHGPSVFGRIAMPVCRGTLVGLTVSLRHDVEIQR